MITYIDHNGNKQVMDRKEAQAIERSGRCSLQHYACTPSEWPEQQQPVSPLMAMRPGATEPQAMWEAAPVAGRLWSYEELCELLRCDPCTTREYMAFCEVHGRTIAGAQSQMAKLMDLIYGQRIRFVDGRIVRGKNAQVHQWPVGFRNRK